MSSENLDRAVAVSSCSDWALIMGTLADDAGGSFYEAYFRAYGNCIGAEYDL